ncbi:ribosomal protein L10-domain-containing protein [Kalaharituber pfeilii]|nr:ribosomal protein L10-domain-containing protein [Kalaharituber pfeilii]
MPRSKRDTAITLSKTQKKPSRENNERLFSQIRDFVDSYQHIFVFSVDNMRNTYLKDVRNELNDSRLFFGKTKVMAKALGVTREDEYRDGLSTLSQHLSGNVGLLFTSLPPSRIHSFFQDFVRTDYSRAGSVATYTFAVPAGIVYSRGGEIPTEDDVPLAHSLESTVRSLGMPTKLVQGKVTLDQEYTVCKEGETLNSNQTRLLKLFGSAMAEFSVRLMAYWSSATGETKLCDSMEEDE